LRPLIETWQNPAVLHVQIETKRLRIKRKGSLDTGQRAVGFLAMREQALTEWRPVDGVSMTPSDDRL
jgi:hypothetical protein